MSTTAVDTNVAARLRLAVARLNRQLRQHGNGGLTLSQLSALAMIEAKQPIRLSDLATLEGIAAPTATRVVASLEDAGYITRRPVPDDKRATLLSVSAQGRQILDRMRRQKTALLERRLLDLSDQEFKALTAALPVLEALAETEF